MGIGHRETDDTQLFRDIEQDSGAEYGCEHAGDQTDDQRYRESSDLVSAYCVEDDGR